MTTEKEEKLAFLKTPDLLVITGSRLYGCPRKDAEGNIISDEDLRGFVLPPIRYLMGFEENFNEAEIEEDEDHKVYSLKRFITLLLNNNAQALECLFVPPHQIKAKTEIGDRILSIRDAFIAKRYYKSITGFSYSEWNKVRGMKSVPIKRSNTEDEAIDIFRNAFKHLSKDAWDEILTICYSEHERKLVPSKQDVGAKRKKEYDEFGYCASCAHHALRLMFQCEEFLMNGTMTFPRPEAELLRAVKQGKKTILELEELYADIRERVDKAYAVSTLPDKPDYAKAWKTYEEIVLEVVENSVMEKNFGPYDRGFNK